MRWGGVEGMLCWPYPCRSLPSSGPLGTYKDSPALGVAAPKGNSQYPTCPGSRPCLHTQAQLTLPLCRETGKLFFLAFTRSFVNLGLPGFLSAQRCCRHKAPHGYLGHSGDREAPRWVQGQT